MLTLIAIAGGLILVAGLAALLHGIRHAPEGREDGRGFHVTGTSRPAGPRRAEPALRAAHAVPHDCLAP